MQILQGQAIALFAFDVGYEISLEQVSKLLMVTPVRPLSRKKPTPNYLQYANVPQVLNLGETELLEEAGYIQATVFDFGAVSIAFRWPLLQNKQPLHLEDLAHFSQQLYRYNLEVHARELVRDLLVQVQPAITRPELSPLIEDYYIFVVEHLAEPLTAEELLQAHSSSLAQTLRFDTQPLSSEQQHDALSQQISYYKDDLVLVDWNAAIVYDPDYSDTINILELINVELLEARYIDAQLDRRIRDYETLVQQKMPWPLPFRTPYQQAIQELTELRLDSTLLAERVDNALKLIGDLYLARVHTAATKRFYLQEWEAAIERKLDIVEDFYQLLKDRVHTAQGQTLELVVIVLILLELFASFIHLK
jgi:hypothetical protein